MRRAKRVLAAVLCLFPALTEAAEVVRAPSVTAAPSPAFLAPAPLAAPALALSAAPSLLAPAAAVPALGPALAVPVLPAPAVAAPVIVAPVSAAADSAALPAARTASGLALDAGRLFDGGRGLAAAKDDGPVQDGAARTPAPRLGAPAPKAKRERSPASRFLRSAAVGVGLAALAPTLWGVIPTVSGLILFSAAILPVAAAATVLLAARAAGWIARRLELAPAAAARPPSTRRGRSKLRALGVAAGIAMAATLFSFQRPLIRAAYSYIESRQPESERSIKTEIPGDGFGEETARALAGTAEGRAALDRVRGADGVPRMPRFFVRETRQSPVPLPGTFFADSAQTLLSRTAVGREVLDGLRDRGGVVRMPTFFVSYQKGSAAQYAPPDVVFLSVSTIESGGVTVSEFLRDPKAQLAYLEREQSVIVHELKHADQARRSPFNVGTWRFLTENGSRLVSALDVYVFGSEAAASDALTPAGSGVKAAAVQADVAAAPITLDAADIHAAGLTVERFIADPQAQKAYIRAHLSELARALKPVPAPAKSAAPAAAPAGAVAVEKGKAKAPPAGFKPGFGMLQEWEYEAYITENLYTHERLKTDPSAPISDEELYGYARGLTDFDEFLRSIDESEIYAANFRGHAPRYERFLAETRAGWDAHRVEAFVLLARRELARGDLARARTRLEQARAIAAEKGLPAPDLVIPEK